MIKLLFFGSGNFPIPILKNLIKSKEINLVGHVTSPHELSRVKDVHIKIFRPKNLKQEQKEILEQTRPDIILVCNYGQILDETILSYPKYGCLNIHGSLLPILRGACPIEMAIIKGFAKTGLTVQLMKKELDSGDILFQEEVAITKNDTGGSLSERLQKLTVGQIEKVIINWAEGKIQPKKQDHSKATYCYRKDISKEAAKIDWKDTAERIERKIRAFNPRPTAWTNIKAQNDHKRLKVFRASISEKELNLNKGNTKVENGKLLVQTGRGILVPEIVQLEGKKQMTIKEFLIGFRETIILD